VTESQESKRSYTDARRGVRVSTIHSAKGLEFPAAACLFADQFPRSWLDDVDEARERHLLYVGLTRACDHLLVTWSPRGGSCFVKSLQRIALGLPAEGATGSP
jgi:DNA helicase-2/ATP-dependent DNA helicase PcrA